MKKLIFILLLLVLLVVGTVFALNQKSESDTAPLELNEEVKKEREEQAKQNKLEEERVKNLINEEKLIKVTDNSIDVYYKVDESKFIGYEILHSSERLDTSVNSSNYDIWHINNANLFSFENGKLSKEKDFVTYGEWDFTLKETGDNDYSGGKAHGDEITNEFRVTVDGNEPENDKLIAFENVKVSTNSTIYRDSTIEEGIEIASKNRTILFDENQLTIEQNIEFLNDLTLDRAYLAMLPVLRTDQAGNQVTDTALVEGNSYNVSQSDFDIPELRDSENSAVTLQGQESGFSASVEVVASNMTPVELSISNNDAYNKIYFKNGGENVSVSSGQTWNQMTNYVLDYTN